VRLAAPIVATLAALAAAGATAVEYRAQAAATWTENISRTSFTPNAKDAASYSLDASATHARQLAPAWTVIGALELGAEQVPDFGGLDRLGAGARATLRRKFGLGPLAPVLDASVGLARVEFREPGRSGWRSDGGLTLAKRLNESWRVAAFAQWESFTAAGAPFDTRHRRLGAEASWAVGERWRLGAGGARLRGQIVANAAWAVWGPAIGGAFGPVVSGYYNSVPWAVTDTFGDGWVAYRVDCTADFLWGEASFDLGERTRAVLRRETVKVVNRISIRYDTEIWSLGVVHRF